MKKKKKIGFDVITNFRENHEKLEVKECYINTIHAKSFSRKTVSCHAESTTSGRRYFFLFLSVTDLTIKIY